MPEAARVLVAGGTFAFSVTHPVRWACPTTRRARGCVVTSSYLDRTPYVELDEDGGVTYVEHHRTLGDWVGLLAAAGLHLDGCSSRSGPRGTTGSGAAGVPSAGRLIPGTAIFRATLAEAPRLDP